MRACSADSSGIFVLLTTLFIFFSDVVSPSCCDKFLAMVLNTDVDKS